jgi:hypothetical protein
MASIRELANCIGVTESDLSILGDFFGFSRATLPPDPTGADVVVSLKRQVDRLEGLHFHLNIIRIGSDLFSDSDKQEIDYSIFKMRDIFHAAGIGVGRILHWGVDSSDTDGLDTPTSNGDLRQITQNWTVPNDGIDLFIPNNMSVSNAGGSTLGRSAIGGTCSNKDKTTGMSGSVAGLWGAVFGTDQTARTVSHELGHYLGLTHRNGRPTNLMCQSGSVVPPGTIRNATDLIERQVNNIGNHCSITSGC